MRRSLKHVILEKTSLRYCCCNFNCISVENITNGFWTSKTASIKREEPTIHGKKETKSRRGSLWDWEEPQKFYVLCFQGRELMLSGSGRMILELYRCKASSSVLICNFWKFFSISNNFYILKNYKIISQTCLCLAKSQCPLETRDCGQTIYRQVH